jgi:hypothetical protein
MALQQTGADLRTLEILQNANTPTLLGSSSTEALDCAGVILMRPMREIQTRDIHPHCDEFTQRRFGA